MLCRRVSSISGLCLLDTSRTTLLSQESPECLHTFPDVPRVGGKSPLLKNHLFIGVVWRTLIYKLQCLESLTGICIITSMSVVGDAADSWTTKTFLFSPSFVSWSVVEILLCYSCVSA